MPGRELAAEFGRAVDCLEWPRRIDTLAPQIPLRIWRGGAFQVRIGVAADMGAA